MEGCINVLKSHLVTVRKVFCPKTSYGHSGTGSNCLLVYSLVNYDYVWDSLVEEKEFLSFRRIVEMEEIRSESNGQTFLAVSNDDNTMTSIAVAEQGFELVNNGTVPLFVYTITTSGVVKTSQAIKSCWGSFFSKVGDVKVSMQVSVYDTRGSIYAEPTDSSDGVVMVTCVKEFWREYCVSNANNSRSTNISNNKQPTTRSMNQFRYLWQGGKQVEEGKRRVFQKLYEKGNDSPMLALPKDHTNKARSSSSEAGWCAVIEKILSNRHITGAVAKDYISHDWEVYSALRQHYYGESLEKALSLSSFKTSGGVVSDESTQDSSGQQPAEDNRALFMVQKTINCIPEYLWNKDNTSKTNNSSTSYKIRNMLDYGCGEGAITAELGKHLQLPVDKIFGADVRFLPSTGYSFVPIPEETDDNSATTLLADIPDHSLDLITCAMVLHHVKNVKPVIQCFKRLLSSQGILIIREHDCSSADSQTGAFLDILHGLYSYVWPSVVDWPNFIEEYYSAYHSREEWTAILASAGLERITVNLGGSSAAEKEYEKSLRSVIRTNYQGTSIPNLTKAYYAVYRHKKDAIYRAIGKLPMSLPLTGDVMKVEQEVHPVPDSSSDRNPHKRAKGGSSSVHVASENPTSPFLIYPSKSRIGHYYHHTVTRDGSMIVEWVQLCVKVSGDIEATAGPNGQYVYPVEYVPVAGGQILQGYLVPPKY